MYMDSYNDSKTATRNNQMSTQAPLQRNNQMSTHMLTQRCQAATYQTAIRLTTSAPERKSLQPEGTRNCPHTHHHNCRRATAAGEQALPAAQLL